MIIKKPISVKVPRPLSTFERKEGHKRLSVRKYILIVPNFSQDILECPDVIVA